MTQSRRDRLAEKLTVQQQRAAYALIDNEALPTKEQRKIAEIAEEVGVTERTVYNWRKKNQAFIEFKKEIAKDYLGDAVGIFAKSVIDSMRGTNGQPSQKALDLYAKLMGFITDNKRIEIADANETRDDAALQQSLDELDDLLADVQPQGDED